MAPGKLELVNKIWSLGQVQHDVQVGYLRGRWRDEFGAKFDVLLYDLTSTYFESDPPFPEGAKRRFGCSRDKGPIGCKWSSP